MIEAASRLILLALAAILLLNLAQGGPSQVKAWLRGKFLNA